MTHFSDHAGGRSLVYRCALCQTTQGDLLRCGGCRLVKYCSRDHQVQDRTKHKSVCKKISSLRKKQQREDDLVRHATPDFMTPANAFETDVVHFCDVSHFWSLVHTRDYMHMRARFGVADHAVELGTLDGVEEGLSHLQDMISHLQHMMQLGRSDNMGLWNKVPLLMLRLGKDQQCYDFIKWYCTTGDEQYDWGDVSFSFLDLKDADVLEEPTHLIKAYNALQFQAAVLILKVKLLLDISHLIVTKKVLKGRLPVELWNQIEKDAIQSPLSSCFVGKPYLDLVRSERRLMLQCRKLGAAINETNGHFVYELLEANEQTLTYKPDHYSPGSYEEAAMALQDSYPAWCETMGALEFMHDARACAAKDSEPEVQDFLDHVKDDRTPEEMLSDLSVNRIWGYIDYAIANGSYLGPREDRPSERWTRENRYSWDQALLDEELDALFRDDED